MSYYDFLRSKVIIAPESGIEIELEEIHPALKPNQRDAVRWALAGGRLFERFGLGKTAQELEHQKDRTKARQKPNRKRKPKCSTS